MCVSVFEQKQVEGRTMRSHSKQENNICKGLMKKDDLDYSEP